MSLSRITRTVAATAATLALALAAGCGASDTANNENTNTDDPTQLTVTAGTLTIATGDPAYTPWVMDDKPESGEGYEAAVAYAVADKMGFDKADVKWIRTTFDAAIAPGAKDWDLNIQQFSITDERKNAVDFSPSYYNPTQSVVVRSDSKYASATAAADFKDATVAAMVGTTSYDFAKEKLNDKIQTFNDNATLAQALDADQVDAIVVDTPTAVNIVKSGQVKEGKVAGQIAGSEDPQGMGIVLPKDSKLTSHVTKAMDALEQDGTLKSLQEKWLKEYTTDIPVLK